MAPKTEKLYWVDPYAGEFEATVIEVRDDALALDRTAFYPSGGGQTCDTGTIQVGEITLDISSVSKEGDLVLHHFDGPYHGNIEVEDEAFGRIDWERRSLLMRAHTSQHVLSGFLKNDHGVDTVDVTIQPGEVSLTITPGISIECFESVLIAVLDFCTTDHPVRSLIVPHSLAIEQYADKVRGSIVDEDPVRIIEIDSLEVMCCGGTHVGNVSEIGPLSVHRFKGGTDIKYRVGADAARAIARVNAGLLEIGASINQVYPDVIDAIRKNLSTLDVLKQREASLVGKLLSLLPASPREKIGDIAIHVLDLPVDRKVVTTAFKEFPDNSLLVLLPGDCQVMVFSSADRVHANRLLGALNGSFGGKGGGNPKVAQGKLDSDLAPSELLTFIKRFIS